MSKLGFLIVVVSSAGCGASEPDLFGDEGTPAASAQELLNKNDPLTNDRIAGVYERTGTNSGIYPGADGKHYTVSNNSVYRIELRAMMLTTVLQCNLTYAEPGRPPSTLLLFTQQNAEATHDFYRIAVPGKQTDRDRVSMSECSIDQPATAWAYCEETNNGSDIFTKLPDGANLCIGRWDQDLMLVDRPYDHGTPIGKKVAN
jgi:hypothetical protein